MKTNDGPINAFGEEEIWKRKKKLTRGERGVEEEVLGGGGKWVQESVIKITPRNTEL